MSNYIKVTPEELTRLAAEFAAQRAEAEQQIRMLQQRMNTLDWEGITAEHFMQRFEMAKILMAQYLERHQIVEEWLKTISQRFAEADQQGMRH